MNYCPICGAKVEGGKFCVHCGASLSDPANSMTSPIGMTAPPSGVDEENPFAFGTQSTVNASYVQASEIPKTMLEAFRICFREKYGRTQGRACMSEYWYFFLFNFLINASVAIVCLIYSITEPLHEYVAAAIFIVMLVGLTFVYSLTILIPSVCVFIRRMHDSDLSGWWSLLTFIPYVGGIIMLYFALRPGTNGPNKYGPKPGSQS